MIEALKIKEIDQMIESFQKEIKSSVVSTVKIQTATPEMVVKKEQKKEQKVVVDDNLFDKLVAKITDRNYKLGECFRDNIKFVSYMENTLTWESCVD
jgi:DNA polymerase-3 subunit gamma/tau